MKSKSIILDMILMTIVIGVGCVDFFWLSKTITAYYSLFPFLSDLILILLPTAITIISVSLSLTKEKIYGATLNEINEIRGGMYFSFLHSVIIMCVIFLVYSSIYVFDLRIASYVLGVATWAYSLIFLYQEISLLIKSKSTIKRILKKRFKERGATFELMSQKKEQIFYKMIQNIILTEGVKTAFDLLNKKGNEGKTLDFLLESQNDYFEEAIEDLPLENFSVCEKNIEANILTAVDVSYENITQLLANSSDFGCNLEISENINHYIVGTILRLHEICVKTSMLEKEKKKLDKIISDYLLFHTSKCELDNATAVIILLCIATIQNGETWFIRFLRDNNFGPTDIFDFELCPIGLFLSMLLAHILQNNILLETEKQKIQDFLLEPTDGLNSFGTNWCESVEMMLEGSNPHEVAKSINKFIIFFKSLKTNEIYLFGNKKKLCYGEENSFTLEDVFSQWIEILLFSSQCHWYDFSLNEIIDGLDENDKGCLFDILSNKWIINGELNKDIKSIFLDTFIIKKNFSFKKYSFNREILNSLLEFYNNVNKERIARKMEHDDNLAEQKQDVINLAEQTIKNNDFFDRNLPLDEKIVFYRFQIYDFDFKSKIISQLKLLPRFFMKIISDEIKKQARQEKREKYQLTDNDAEIILYFKPEFTTEMFIVNQYEGKYFNEINELNLKESNGITTPHVYFKAEAIKFNADIIENQTIVRRLTNDELEEIIQNNYQPLSNGLYRYSEYRCDANSFLVTKEELKKYLEKQIISVQIAFKMKVVVDDNNCLIFVVNKEKEEKE